MPRKWRVSGSIGSLWLERVKYLTGRHIQKWCRARGLVRLRRLTDNQKIKSSNLFGPTIHYIYTTELFGFLKSLIPSNARAT